MAADDQDGRWGRQLLTGLGALVATTLVIGVVVGVAALGAMRLLGLDEGSPQARSAPTLYLPSGTPTTSPEFYPDPVEPSSGATEASPSAESPGPAEGRKRRRISLQAFPARVSPGERIHLTGVYRAGEGATLQVQRFEGGAWADFPVSVTVRGGIFETFVTTSRTGRWRFRVVQVGSGKASNPVAVTIG
jgi:hypothetical protein